jgi:hypothetical protein
MRQRLIAKGLSLCFCSVAFVLTSAAQDCTVEHQSLKGTYAGECKKGKAHGKGKAVGTDTYEGEFKSGQPDGQGTYTWSNGNTFQGKFSKGLREGEGTMVFKRTDGVDSTMQGFWKKDNYIGKYEKPWKIYSKSGSIRDVDVEFNPDKTIHQVKITITSTSGGSTSGTINATPERLEKPKVDNIQVLLGSYTRMTTLDSRLKATEVTLTEAIYPLRMKIAFAGSEELEIELFENGTYQIDISINK